MATIFSLDKSDLKNLEKFFKVAPFKFAKAARGLLNGFAFGTRQESVKQINRRMTVRNTRFVNSVLRFNRARGNDINTMVSEAGSIGRDRFDGWKEQEEGVKTKRSRVATFMARGNNKQKQIRPSMRMKPNHQFINENTWELNVKNNSRRVPVFLMEIARRGYTKPFIISRRYKNYKRGLYIRRRKRIRLLQSFEPANVQPKRIKWLTAARANFFKRTNLRNEWAKAIKFALKLK